ncbi:TetR/AcrR family transcriptional regulator [Parasphingopyxis algicola]|uniref:TetR/AcrR family transcriptional regulator n=1 Tax=Parasphingopyxis algicola TaxID=2026624 RepID=UPI0015A314A1|nr:TetR/AcrR family transcriptional regulator [Parasphingopyxis algicola]QLC24272.1 TetR/AcrR family transcriptional regulator [Parasphingopyxis algicola]
MTAPSTRDRLIDAAFRVVARDGLDAASVKAIAAEAGVKPGLLHYHFKTKDEVLEAAVERGLETYLDRLRGLLADTPPDRVLAAYADFIRDNLEAHRDLFRVRLGLAVRAMNDPALGEKLAQANARAQDSMAQIFAAHMRAAKPGERHHAIARTAKSSFEGIMLSWLSQPGYPMRETFDVWEGAVREMIAKD